MIIQNVLVLCGALIFLIFCGVVYYRKADETGKKEIHKMLFEKLILGYTLGLLIFLLAPIVQENQNRKSSLRQNQFTILNNFITAFEKLNNVLMTMCHDYKNYDSK